jgi:hypothetical protein
MDLVSQRATRPQTHAIMPAGAFAGSASSAAHRWPSIAGDTSPGISTAQITYDYQEGRAAFLSTMSSSL